MSIMSIVRVSMGYPIRVWVIYVSPDRIAIARPHFFFCVGVKKKEKKRSGYTRLLYEQDYVIVCKSHSSSYSSSGGRFHVTISNLYNPKAAAHIAVRPAVLDTVKPGNNNNLVEAPPGC